MNRLSYRVVFNAKRGQLVAVAESATSQGKSCGERAGRKTTDCLRRAVHTALRTGSLSVLALAAFLATQPAAIAQIIADPTAPANQRPTVLPGVTVNIQTPSAAGVSRNTYSRFDMGASDTVTLNNNRTSNPWLATGSARVILNEVRSSNPSNLAGQLIVDGAAPNGARADVVFANPSGINVNGLSVSGAGRFTLTTGAPVITAGALTGFNVTTGNVQVASGGFAVNGAGSYAEILSRSAVIGGIVRADQAFNVITGPQTVDYATGSTTPLAGTGTQPTLAIDTKAWGGMYAGSITMLSTEAGVGVRNDGTLQANTGSGQLIVTADGRLQNTGRMDAAYTSVATVAADIDNSGNLLGRKLLMASAGGNFNQVGTGMAQNEAATSPLSDPWHTAYNIGAGMAQDSGSASQVFINAKQDVNVAAGARIASNASVTAADGTLTKGQVVVSAGRNVNLSTWSNLNANGAVQLSSDGMVNGTANTVSSATGDATMLAKQGISLSDATVTGNKVHLETGAAFEETSSSVTINRGQINSTEHTAVIASGDLWVDTPDAAHVRSAGNVFLQAGKNLTLTGGTNATAGNHFTAVAGDALQLRGDSGATAQTNKRVSITSGGDTTLSGGSIWLHGSSVKAAGGIDIEASKSHAVLYALPNQNSSSHTAVNLEAGRDLNISAYSEGIFAQGLNASGENVTVLSNGVTQINRVEQSTPGLEPLQSNISARADLTVGSIHSNAAVELKGSNLTANVGHARLIGGGSVLATSGTHERATLGGDYETVSILPRIVARDITIQGGTLFTEGAAIRAFNGHVNLSANNGAISLSTSSRGDRTDITASGNIAIHAKDGLTSWYTDARAGKNLALTSATDKVTATGNILIANDILSVSSKGEQSHFNGFYDGGALSFFNESGAQGLVSSRVQTRAIQSPESQPISGNLSIDSGGTFYMDAASVLSATSDLSLASGLGDMNINPRGWGGGTLTLDQIGYGRNLSLTARGGAINLQGGGGTNGFGSTARVSLSTPNGSLSLVGNSVNLQGSQLRADGGAIKVAATTGNVSTSALVATKLESGFTNTYWDRPELISRDGIDILAVGDITVDGMYAHSWGKTNFLSGGSITIATKINNWQVDNRPSAGSGYNGWYESREYLTPTLITGDAGLSLGAMGGHLIVNGAELNAARGALSLRALGNVVLENAQEHFLADASSWRTNCTWYGHCTTYTTFHKRENLTIKPVVVRAATIDVHAGNNVVAYATQFNSTGDINVTAGDDTYYYAAYNEVDNTDTTEKRRSLWGVRYNSSTSTNSTRALVGKPAVLQSTGSIVSLSGGDQLLQGTQAIYGGGAWFRAGVGETARADARVVLQGVMDSVTESRTKESNYVVWQKQLGSGSTVETMTLPSFTGPQRPVFSAPGGIAVQIPAGELTSQIQTLSQQPGMGYLTELSQRHDVNWQPVKLAYDQWSYEQEGLTAAGAALLSVAVAWVTGGMGAELLGTTGTVTSAAANAAFTSLAAQASITLVNNKGNIGKTLSDLARSDIVKATLAAALTAGALGQLNALPSMQNLNLGDPLATKLAHNLINASGRALVNTAVNGGSLEDALKQALVGGLVDTAHGAVASQIKLAGFDYLSHKLAHALAGCVAGAAAGGECRDGAIGAAVGEVVAEMFKGQKPDLSTASDADINAYREKVVAYSKLVAGAVSAYAGGDAQTAIATAETAVRNNYLNHYKKNGLLSLSEVEQYNQAVAACQTGDAAACGRRDTLVATSLSRDRALSSACGDGPAANPVTCNTLVREARSFGNVVNGSYGGFVWANSPNRGFGLNVSTVSAPGRPANFHDALARSTATGLALVVNGPEDLIVGAVVAYGGRAAVVAMEGAQKVLLLPNNLVIKVDSIDWTKQAFMPGLPPGAVSGVNLQTGEIVARLFGGQVVSYGNKVELAPVLRSADGSTVWVPGIERQGIAGEKLLGRQDRGIGLNHYEPGIDVWDPINGLAVSQKTLDWNAPTYANNAAEVERRLKIYVDQLGDYQGTGSRTLIGFDTRIAATQIKAKALEVVLPSTGGSQAQIDAVSRAIDYARLKGIDTKIYKAN